MQLYLEIINGEMNGSWTQIRDSLTIGRKKSMLNVRDPKVSSKHAEVKERPDGTFWLVDLGSQNAIKIGGQRVTEIQLKEGTSFFLGDTEFAVRSWDEADLAGKPSLEMAPMPKKTWVDLLLILFGKGERGVKAEEKQIKAISPPLELEFTKGPQTGTIWVIGYGPRVIGSGSPDLTIEDPELTGVCFKLLPDKEGTVFKNESDARINGKFVESTMLRGNEVIDLKNTQIRVRINEQV